MECYCRNAGTNTGWTSIIWPTVLPSGSEAAEALGQGIELIRGMKRQAGWRCKVISLLPDDTAFHQALSVSDDVLNLDYTAININYVLGQKIELFAGIIADRPSPRAASSSDNVAL
jgi:hypothetical protein